MDIIGNLVGIVLGIAIIVGVSLVILLLLTVLILRLLKQVKWLAKDVRSAKTRVGNLATVVEKVTGDRLPAQQAEPQPAPAPEPAAGSSVYRQPPPPPPTPQPWPGPMEKRPTTDPIGIPAQQREVAPQPTTQLRAQPNDQPTTQLQAQPRRGRHARGDQ